MYLYIDELVDILYIYFIVIFVMDKCIVEWFLMFIFVIVINIFMNDFVWEMFMLDNFFDFLEY